MAAFVPRTVIENTTVDWVLLHKR